MQAIGVLEVSYFTNGIVVIDQMMKDSDISLVSLHKTLGGKMIHAIVSGSTSHVDMAMDSARDTEHKIGEGMVKVAVTISNPHAEVLRLLNMIERKGN